MIRMWRFAVPAALVTLAIAGTASAGTVGLPAWDVVRSRNSGDGPNELLGVAALSTDEVWAVGSRGDRTLTERWDGSAFSIVPSPNVRGRASVLEDVAGTASTDLWAVGHADVTDFIGSRTLVLHWNGTAWSRIPAPSFGSQEDQNVLTGVAAISPNDAWAVGSFSSIDPGSATALTLHWNGSAWRTVPNACGRGLREVFALSATNVWAVGGESTCRWNGATWTPIPVDPGPNSSVYVDLQDVSGTAANDLWAAGVATSSCGEGQVCFSGVIEHWNGAAWSFMGVGQVLYGVHALSSDDVYAVGIAIGATILHFDGSGWATVPPPTPTVSGTLFAVEAASPVDLWAVGSRLTSETRATVAERAPSPTSGAVVGMTRVSGATVSWFGPESGSVEAEPLGGRYQVGGLDAGQYTFVATNPGCSPASKEVTVVAGTTISVALRPGC